MPEYRGAPPGVRQGQPIWSGGRRVVAGIAPFERSLSPRAQPPDLWAALDASVGYDSLKALSRRLGGTGLRRTDVELYGAFLRQAKEFFLAQRTLGPESKPLAGYYFVLNLSKALLVAAEPVSLRGRITHGVSVRAGTTSGPPAPDANGSHEIEHAFSNAQANGVFPLLAKNTGASNRRPVGNPVPVHSLFPYLTEATDEYLSMAGAHPPLLPVHSITVLQKDREAWLQAAVDTDLLKRRQDLSPAKLPGSAAMFGANFKFTGNDTEAGLSIYESEPHERPRSRETWSKLSEVLDRSLVGVDRSKLGGQWYVTLDDRNGLISYEAITFLVMHHLSEMVRYQPSSVERMLNSKYSWVLTTWVNRACENFLLTLASRITNEEHRIRA